MSVKRKVAYFYDPELGNYYYGQAHPMKPHRIRVAHNLILHYGLHNMMQVFQIRPASYTDFTSFHAEDYIDFLRNVNVHEEGVTRQMKSFNCKEDCPVFDGIYQYCQLYAGGSMSGAVKINHGESDCVINWAGGLHHAKKGEASGFCYVNDIVMAILELLKYHARVLYVDIDIHHGDGVEEAFLTTERVMTVSFHKFGGNFFPGTGDVVNVGRGRGKYYSVNIPLKDGIDDHSYELLFKPVMQKVMQIYQPEVVVCQCGADSLAGDKLGAFNLSMKGHAECLSFMRSFGVPMLVLGGGGYKISNVARCWAYETGCLLDVNMGDIMPPNEYETLFGGSGARFHVPVLLDVPNRNSREYLERTKQTVLDNLSKISAAPGVAFYERAPDAEMPDAPEGEARSSSDEGNSRSEGESKMRKPRLWSIPGIKPEAQNGSSSVRSESGDL
ncbi:hypothetical protein WJX84_009469 [Apatococcus fuscideae]|uniref:Histone deacetylase n=1 Tax=Apatococcus fuscideae TaxID=2026836 RepID=A0AAW1TD00_9CHLO